MKLCADLRESNQTGTPSTLRHSLVSELLYIGQDGFTEMTGALPFVTSLKAPRSVLNPLTIRAMAQKDHLSKLTSFTTEVTYGEIIIYKNGTNHSPP